MFSTGHREEKPLRHSAMVANFLNDNKSKRHLKSGLTKHCFNFIHLILFHLICHSYVGEIFWVKSERTITMFRTEKENFVLCLPTLKQAHDIRF